jgi:hypothetical protein
MRAGAATTARELKRPSRTRHYKMCEGLSAEEVYPDHFDGLAKNTKLQVA